jgi:hypothetical protein
VLRGASGFSWHRRVGDKINSQASGIATRRVLNRTEFDIGLDFRKRPQFYFDPSLQAVNGHTPYLKKGSFHVKVEYLPATAPAAHSPH